MQEAYHFSLLLSLSLSLWPIFHVFSYLSHVFMTSVGYYYSASAYIKFNSILLFNNITLILRDEIEKLIKN